MTKQELIALLEPLPDNAFMAEVEGEYQRFIELVWQEDNGTIVNRFIDLPFIPLNNITTWEYYNKFLRNKNK